MTGFCSWSEVYLVLINIEKKALYWQNSHFWPLLRRGAKLAVLSSGSKRWDPIRSINYGNVWKYTLNPNLKDCRKQEKKKPLEEKTDLFTVSRKVVLRIEFCSSSHLLPFPEGQRQASSGCTNIVHQDKLPFTCHSVWSYHPFILCFIAHIGCQRWPAGQGF